VPVAQSEPSRLNEALETLSRHGLLTRARVVSVSSDGATSVELDPVKPFDLSSDEKVDKDDAKARREALLGGAR